MLATVLFTDNAEWTHRASVSAIREPASVLILESLDHPSLALCSG
jgi:hypothetical protein